MLAGGECLPAPVARRSGPDDGTQRLRCAPAAADHLAVVLLRDGELQHDGAVVLLELLDGDLFGLVDQPLREVDQELLHPLHRHRVVSASW